MGLIGSALGSLAGSVIGGIAGGGEDPRLKAPEYKQSTQLLMGEQQKRADRSMGDYQNIGEQGIEEGRSQMLQPDEVKRQDVALGGATPDDLQGAIQRRANKQYERGISGTKRGIQVSAFDKQQDAKQNYFNLEMQKKQMDQEFQKAVRQAQQEQESNRNSVLDSVIGAGGKMLGGGLGALTAKKPLEPTDTKMLNASQNNLDFSKMNA